MRRLNDSGIALIGSYVVVALLMVYSASMTMRSMNQNLVTVNFQEGAQSVNLAQAAMEQLQEDFYIYFSRQVYQLDFNGNANKALKWLDNYKPLHGNVTGPGHKMDFHKTSVLNVVSGVTGDGTISNPREVVLSSMLNSTGRSWITGIRVEDANDNGTLDPGEDLNGDGILNTGAYAPRFMTIEATAIVGDATKRVQATYEIALESSAIFDYAYFVNNYGWFEVADDPSNFWSNEVRIWGDVGSNGDLFIDFDSSIVGFSSGAPTFNINGNMVASSNPHLYKINGPPGVPMDGDIIINDNDPTDQNENQYWNSKAGVTDVDHYKTGYGKPTKDLTLAGQQEIAGGDNRFEDGYDAAKGIQKEPNRPPQDIPYLGDLSMYRAMAKDNAKLLPAGVAPIEYYPRTWDGSKWVESAAPVQDKDGVIKGSTPLILWGTKAHPIKITGPVVIDGDVIIRGFITGQGTIYAGRNVHVVGEIKYVDPPYWAALERETGTGQIRDAYDNSDRGKVCNDGSYIAAGGGSCP